VVCTHPGTIPGWSEYLWNLRILCHSMASLDIPHTINSILHTARRLDHAQWTWVLIGHTPLCGVQEWQQLLLVSDPTMWCYICTRDQLAAGGGVLNS